MNLARANVVKVEPAHVVHPSFLITRFKIRANKTKRHKAIIMVTVSK